MPNIFHVFYAFCGLSLLSFLLLWAICAGGAVLSGRLYEADEEMANPNQAAERR